MEFYKLFHIIHRRTDWDRLYEWQRKTMMPEWYKNYEQELECAVNRLMKPIRAINNMLGDKAQFYF